VKAMTNKLKYLINVSLKRKVATKWFVIANVVLALVVIGLANIDTLVKAFGGDFDKDQIVYVIDKTDKSYEVFKSQTDSLIKQIDMGIKYDIKLYEKDLESATKKLEEDPKAWIVVFDNDEATVINAKIITESYLSAVDNQILTTSINSSRTFIAIAETNISEKDLTKILSQTPITREYLDETKKSEEENIEMIMSTVFPIVILPFFMLTIFLVQMIGAEVNDEKTTRGMEIIISNVSPKTHFFSKVIAGNLFVIIQGLLLFLYGGIGIITRNLIGGSSVQTDITKTVGESIKAIMSSNLGDKLIYVIPLTLILMLITFIGYSLLAGILASMSTNIEDFQQVQTPIMIISVIGYYLSMLSGLFEGSILIRAFSYIPFISAILSPSLLVFGHIGVIDVLISIMLMLGTIYLLITFGLRIYKVGILNYSSSDLWKKMFKALKN
jgi:ABC-2 type transport system permease protein